MKVIRIKPHRLPELIEIDNSLEAIEREVDGHIQGVYPWWGDPIAFLYDADGKEKGKPFNIGIYDAHYNMNDYIAGTLLVVGRDGEKYTSIGEYEEKYLKVHEDKDYCEWY